MFKRLSELNSRQIITLIIVIIYIPTAVYLTISGGLIILLILSAIIYFAFTKWLKEKPEDQ